MIISFILTPLVYPFIFGLVAMATNSSYRQIEDIIVLTVLICIVAVPCYIIMLVVGVPIYKYLEKRNELTLRRFTIYGGYAGGIVFAVIAWVSTNFSQESLHIHLFIIYDLVGGAIGSIMAGTFGGLVGMNKQATT